MITLALLRRHTGETQLERTHLPFPEASFTAFLWFSPHEPLHILICYPCHQQSFVSVVGETQTLKAPMTSLSSQSTDESWPLVDHSTLPYHKHHIPKKTAGTTPLRHTGSVTGHWGVSRQTHMMVRGAVRTMPSWGLLPLWCASSHHAFLLLTSGCLCC